MSRSLLTLSIGPVQSFIEQARRAEDLFAGSQLLTRLMLAAHQAVEGHTIIYPARSINGAKHPESLTHKLLVELELENNQAMALAQQVEQHIRAQWNDVAATAWDRLSRYVIPDKTQWRNQINQLPEIYWTLTPFDVTDYATSFKQAGRDFATRKMLRNFDPFEEVGPKCTVCGERAALHRPDQRASDYWAEIAKHPEVSFAKLRPNGREQLCAICAVKRFGDLNQTTYPSVSEVAAVPFKQLLLDQMQDAVEDTASGLRSALTEIGQRLALLDKPRLSQPTIPALQPHKVAATWQDLAKMVCRYDGEWFFPETYERLQVESDHSSTTDINRAQKAIVQLLESIHDRPNSYYAILYADGDKMGKHLSEAIAHGKERHIAISKALAEFAAIQARDVVEDKHAGRVIYAGGDDVLALLPAVEALSAANALRKQYSHAMSELLTNPTMSVGVAIVHHLAPLTLALQAARRAEKAAKNRFDRNAVAVIFRKRSGEEILVGAKWTLEQKETDMATFLKDVRDAFVAKNLSLGIGHTLLAEAVFLDGSRHNTDETLPSTAQQAEVQRLFARAAAKNLSKEKKRAQTHRMTGGLMNLAGSIKTVNESKNCRANNSNEAEVPLMVAARWLVLMRFLAQEGGLDG